MIFTAALFHLEIENMADNRTSLITNGEAAIGQEKKFNRTNLLIKERSEHGPGKNVLFVCTLALIVCSCFCVMSSVFLLIGLCVDSRILLVPWMIFVSVTTIMDFFYALYMLIESVSVVEYKVGPPRAANLTIDSATTNSSSISGIQSSQGPLEAPSAETEHSTVDHLTVREDLKCFDGASNTAYTSTEEDSLTAPLK